MPYLRLTSAIANLERITNTAPGRNGERKLFLNMEVVPLVESDTDDEIDAHIDRRARVYDAIAELLNDLDGGVDKIWHVDSLKQLNFHQVRHDTQACIQHNGDGAGEKS